eukprot:282376_1
MSVKLALNLLVLFTLSIPSIKGLTTINPTISNSSGDYFISQQDSDFSTGEIVCHSNTYCHIQCDHDTSCYNIDIDCKNAELCVIDCYGRYACGGSNLYVSSKNTQINCIGESSCGPKFDDNPFINNTKIYTDYPLSHTILTCSESGSYYQACYTMDILSSDKTGYVDLSNFKIYCPGAYMYNTCPLHLSQPFIYPLAIPNIINETGEYYDAVGSFVNITCAHNLLCLVNCSYGSCASSYINCNGSNICSIHCGGDGDCGHMKIKATNNNIFQLECISDGENICNHGTFFIEHVKTVNIQTNRFGFGDSDFYIKNVHELHIDCGTQLSCKYTKWYIYNNSNVTISGLSSLNYANFNIINSQNVDIFCGEIEINGYLDSELVSWILDSCKEIEINGYSSDDNFKIDLFCEEAACQDSIISINGQFNASCCGNSSCDRMQTDDSMDPSMVMINCDCGGLTACTNLTTFHMVTTEQPISINKLNIHKWIKSNVAPIVLLLTFIIIAAIFCYYKLKKQKLNKEMKYVRQDLVNEIEEKIPTEHFR